MMKRSRWFAVIVLCLPVCPHAQEAKAPDASSCKAFVQGFYDWYVPRAIKAPTLDLALKTRASDFAPSLVQQLKEDIAASARVKDEVVGLDFDPFLNGQDLGKRYVVDKAVLKNGNCWADVYDMTGKKAKAPDVVPELAPRNKGWVFVNFHYPNYGDKEDENLVSVLNVLKKTRQRPAK